MLYMRNRTGAAIVTAGLIVCNCTVSVLAATSRRGSAVGLANIDILEREKLAENAGERGAQLLAGLQTLTEFPQVDNARGQGLLCGIEFVKDKESREPDPAMALAVHKAALERGLWTRVLGNTIPFAPSLVIDEEEVDQIITTLGAVLDSM